MKSVAAVDVAVHQSGAGGGWWDAATNSWASGVVENQAQLATPGRASTNWTFSFKPPVGGGSFSVDASGVNGLHVAGAPVTTSFRVSASATAPFLRTDQARLSPGSAFTVSGGGFASKERVTIAAATSPPTKLGTGLTTSGGVLPLIALTMPAAPPFGPLVLTATGATSGRTANATVTVANDWASWRDGLTQQGFEAHDTVLQNVSAGSEATFLNPAWSTGAGGPVLASAAVAGGVAYYGDQAGHFDAVNVHTGVPVWASTLGGAIDSSAAVDLSAGLLVVGTGNRVVALRLSNGTVLWSRQTGGPVESSPQIADSRVFVGSDDHSVYSLNEASGSVIWSAPLKGAVRSSPAVDLAQKVVIVGDDSGAVTELQFFDGSTIWAHQTNGKVDSSPLIYQGPQGTVFVGSDDHKLYALSEVNGALDWAFTTGGPVDDSPAMVNGQLVVGSGDGSVYYLGPVSGTRLNTFSPTAPPSPVVGVSATEGFVVVETAGGAVFGTRPSGSLTNWRWGGTVALASSPTVDDGAVYVTGEDGTLRAFTPTGAAPY